MTTPTLPPHIAAAHPPAVVEHAPDLIHAASRYVAAVDALRVTLGAPEDVRLLAVPLDTCSLDTGSAVAEYAEALHGARIALDQTMRTCPPEKRAALLDDLPSTDAPPVALTYSDADALYAVLAAYGVHVTRSAFNPELLEVFTGPVDGPTSALPVVRAVYATPDGPWTVAPAPFDGSRRSVHPSVYSALTAVLVRLGEARS